MFLAYHLGLEDIWSFAPAARRHASSERPGGIPKASASWDMIALEEFEDYSLFTAAGLDFGADYPAMVGCSPQTRMERDSTADHAVVVFQEFVTNSRRRPYLVLEFWCGLVGIIPTKP
jgi:hypothetical protein